MQAFEAAARVGLIAAGLVMAAAWALPQPAEACGGTFCDTGPTAMPVDQTGETILFVIDEGFVEAHIQIQYDPQTTAEQFAWVVPVTALPEFSVGSQPLVSNALAGTVPSYGYTFWQEPCDAGDDGFCDGTGAADDGGETGFKLDAAAPPPDEPEVVLETTVGAFEVFVLDGGTVQGVMQWLGDNGFAQDPAAEPILAEYLAEGHLFVALRLMQQADAAEIHPIVLRYPGVEPCVPIRLTRIAAKEDMEIRALFLADGRVASSNWRHVTLNPLKIDWIALGASYREVVSMAVDTPGADGHAFVTEYAGPSDTVRTDGILGPLWDPSAFETATPDEAVLLLFSQELYGESDGIPFGCGAFHPLVQGLVDRYLPVLSEVDPWTICDDPQAYIELLDLTAWDGPAFAADLEARVIVPSQHALELLEGFPYITRLYTTLSPVEMTEDPMFHLTLDLPDQVRVWRGTNNVFCDGARSFGLPDGRLVAIPPPGTWPDIAPEQMPWVETVEYLPAAGAPVVEADHRGEITALLEAWNAEHGPPRPPVMASCHGGETGGTTGDTDSAGLSDDGGGKGCGCRSDGGAGSGVVALLSVMLLGLGRRRRPAWAARGSLTG